MKIVAYLTLVFLSHGCVSESIESTIYIEDLNSWFTKNASNYIKTKEFDKVSISAKFMPNEFRISRGFLNHTSANNQEKFESQLNELRGEYVFHVRIEGKSGVHPLKIKTNTSDYFGKLQHMSTDIKEQILLVADQKDTTYCSMTHLERNYETAPFLNLVAGFKGVPQAKKSLTLVYNDKIFGIGIINYLFEADEIHNIPKILI